VSADLPLVAVSSVGPVADATKNDNIISADSTNLDPSSVFANVNLIMAETPFLAANDFLPDDFLLFDQSASAAATGANAFAAASLTADMGDGQFDAAQLAGSAQSPMFDEIIASWSPADVEVGARPWRDSTPVCDGLGFAS